MLSVEYFYFNISIVIGLVIWSIKFNCPITGVCTLFVLFGGVPIAVIINRWLLGIDYFVHWHIFSCFIATAIATNNTFFTYDKWIESNTLVVVNKSLNTRIAYAVSRTFKVNTVSTLAIVLSLYLSNLSTIMPI